MGIKISRVRVDFYLIFFFIYMWIYLSEFIFKLFVRWDRSVSATLLGSFLNGRDNWYV